MQAIKVKAKIIGSGIDYRKRISGLSAQAKLIMKNYHNIGDIFFYCVKPGKRHYTQSGYKTIIYNPGRFEFYHREPTTDQYLAIIKSEGKKGGKKHAQNKRIDN